MILIIPSSRTPKQIYSAYIFAVIFVFIFLVHSPNTFAKNNSLLPIQGLHIQQERLKSNGVLVSRPKQLDLDLVKIVQVNHIQSLDDYSLWLKKNIQYRVDRSLDSWAKASETLQNRFGDCEDFAFLTIAMLRLLGYQPRFLAIQKPGMAHAICVFKFNGTYHWFDNAQLKRTGTQTIQEFSKHMTQQYQFQQMLELDLETHQWQLIFQSI